jgi:hypothetical protein
MWRNSVIVFCCSILAVPGGQTGVVSRNSTAGKKLSGAQATSFKYRNMADDVSFQAPAANHAVLQSNTLAVQEADKEIRTAFSNIGLKDPSIDRIEFTAWSNFSKEHPNASFTEASFKTYALSRFGGLHVQSTPDKAAVWVNNEPWGLAPAEEGVPIGTKHIKLHLEGYLDAEGDVEVTPGKMVVFAKVLQKKDVLKP